MEVKSAAAGRDRVAREHESEGGKRVYAAPELIQWGTILELTGGTLNGTFDGFFSGTTGT